MRQRRSWPLSVVSSSLIKMAALQSPKHLLYRPVLDTVTYTISLNDIALERMGTISQEKCTTRAN